MPVAVRFALIVVSLPFLAIGLYYRIRAAKSGDRLDRTKEGWPILIGLRLTGLATLASIAAWLWSPEWFEWASFPMPDWARWVGVGGFAFSIAWLIWMFICLGSNLTDTVETRKDAHFVESGPYRYVRNPMYSGILIVGPSLGLALGTWLVPLATTLMFLILARRTRIEETWLIARFGNQYRSYMSRVGRFFPHLLLALTLSAAWEGAVSGEAVCRMHCASSHDSGSAQASSLGALTELTVTRVSRSMDFGIRSGVSQDAARIRGERG